MSPDTEEDRALLVLVFVSLQRAKSVLTHRKPHCLVCITTDVCLIESPTKASGRLGEQKVEAQLSVQAAVSHAQYLADFWIMN